MTLLPRILVPWIQEALRRFPVVILTGARQTGKTTLVSSPPISGGRVMRSLDDFEALDLARSRPEAILEAADRMTIDEVQQAPELLRAIKRSVDRDRRAGRFLLTGSANLLMMRRVSESLAGRAVYLQLSPLTESEKEGSADPGPWTALLEAADPRGAAAKIGPARRPVAPADRILPGGYPAAVAAATPGARASWFDGYVRTYLERDLQSVAAISNLPDFRRLMKFAALRIGQVLNQTTLGNDASLPNYTVHRYLNLLEASYQIVRLPPYAGNRNRRLVKSPKLYWTDVGLGAFLGGVHSAADLEGDARAGALAENLLLMQLAAWRDTVVPRPELFFWRTRSGEEVDFVIERGRRLLPIELKLGARPRLSDTRGIDAFIEAHPKAAPFGLLIHGGREVEPLTDRVLAVPLEAVWRR